MILKALVDNLGTNTLRGKFSIKGQVVKAVASQYTVKIDGKFIECVVRGTVKKDIDIYVGDFVEVVDKVIVSVYPRKNILIRPYVTNIDALLIMVSPTPLPDWTLVEKLILTCHTQNIFSAIVLNKCDLMTVEEREAFVSPYKDFDIFFVSAKTGEGIDKLKEYMKGKLVCFAGQSAVGKSSVISLLQSKDLAVGELSKKIKRGKNTTRQIEIFDTEDGQVVDTCGFSVLEGIDIRYDELVYYYEEFIPYQSQCKYSNCTHTTEPKCAVREAVARGEIDINRYNRYVNLYNKFKDIWRNKYV